MSDLHIQTAILNLRKEGERQALIRSIYGTLEAYEAHMAALRAEYFVEGSIAQLQQAVGTEGAQ